MSTIEEQKRLVRARCDAWKWGVDATPLSRTQKAYPTDLPLRGPFWISRTSLPKPAESGVIECFLKAFDLLKSDPRQSLLPSSIVLSDVSLEWLGPRSGGHNSEPEPNLPESAKYEHLASEAKTERTVLHLHGGAFYAGSAASWRFAPMQLCRRTGYRVAAPTYRLAPQEPFPSALLDVFVTYLSLLSPAPQSLHQPIQSSNVILAGDSAGANLALGLVQILLTLRRAGHHFVPFHGREVPLDLPAGLTVSCTYADLTNAMPSWFSNGQNDLLEILQPALLPNFPRDDIWPSKPPRGNPYSHESALDHPLVSPCAADDWHGAPPMWFGAGSEERGVDGQKCIAARAQQQGVSVLWDEYDGMCHCFATVLGKLPQSTHCFNGWADAVTRFADGNAQITSRMRLLRMPDCTEEILDPATLAPLSFETTRMRMRRKAEEHPPWTGRAAPIPKTKAAL